MNVISIQFPADRNDIAVAIGTALSAIGLAKANKTGPISDQVAEATLDSGSAFQPAEHSGDAGLEIDEQLIHTGKETAGDGTVATQAKPAGPVDMKGVHKNDAYCMTAVKPFYASGKYKGQWKKAKNTPQDEYDAWYEDALAEVKTGSASTGEVNTAAAFGGQDAAQESGAPKDCGNFMAWISELQAAGRLQQQDVTAAYQECGIAITDLFAPNDADTIESSIKRLHHSIQSKVRA